ncbi:MAG: hypothetical protein WC264_02390 [Candidatus Paceibacterota bacterium]|jgi:hypothetical protein
MKKNELLQSVKIIVVCLVFGLGVASVFSAGQFSSPIKPINVGTSPQVMNSKLSVNSFLATNNTLFSGGVKLNNLADTNATENRPICADNTGKIVVCNP